MATAHLYCICGLGVPPLSAAVTLIQVQAMAVESCVVYKAICDYSFLDKEFLHSWCMYANNKGAMHSSGVSLVSLW